MIGFLYKKSNDISFVEFNLAAVAMRPRGDE